MNRFAYGPVLVVHPGLVFWTPGGWVVTGWMFDLNGRPDRSDWQAVYQRDCARAAAAFIAKHLGGLQVEETAAPVSEIEAMRVTQSLLARVSQPARKPSLLERIANRFFAL